MKNIAWNILAVVVLLAIIAVAFVVLSIYSNPNSPLNPYPPPTLPADLLIPTRTLTPIFLPATWTPQPAILTDARPSSTLIPSATTFKLITNTPLPTLTETPTETVFVPSSTPSALAYFCILSIGKQLDGGSVTHDEHFDGSWTIQNGGSETWDSSQMEVRFITGTILQTKGDTLKLSSDVPTGSSLKFSLDMKAPTAPGIYYSTWGLMQGSRVICRWTIAINVPKY